MMIDFPTKAWKKIDDAKKIISEFEGLDISDPIMLVEISRQFSRDYDFNWLTKEISKRTTRKQLMNASMK